MHTPHALFNLGTLHQQRGDTAAAVDDYRRAIASGHQEYAAKAAVNLGFVLFDQAGDIEGAREAFRAAIATGHPEQAPLAARNLEALQAVVQQTAAGERLDVTDDSTDVSVGRGKGQLHHRLWVGQDAAPQDQSQDHPEGTGGSGAGTVGELTVTLARDAYQAGKTTAGDYEAQLIESVSSPHRRTAGFAAANLAQLVEQLGEVHEAERLYRLVLQDYDPTVQFYPASANALANIVVQQGHNDEAERLWRQALASGDPDVAPMAAVNLGAALTIWGRPTEAFTVLQVAIDSGHPEEVPAALLRLASIHAQRGDLEAARSALEAVVSTGHREFVAQARGYLDALP